MEKEKNIMIIFEGEYLNNTRWNGKMYNNINDEIYELKKGKGFIKLYDEDGKLGYEGEYLNGKGKEYYNYGQLKFEGEYFNGKKWNGKGYDNSNKCVYELKNGNGHIKEYGKQGKLSFDCDYINGEINGTTRFYKNGWIIFEGEFVNGNRHRKGIEYDDYYYRKEILKFEGDYLYNLRIKGKLYYDRQLEYDGEFLFKQNGMEKAMIYLVMKYMN